MNEITTHIDTEAIERLMLEGDLSRLTPEQRIQFYRMKCELLKLDPGALPFQYMRLSGKLTLYATKNCAEQLRMKHGVSISEPKTEQIGDIFLVTVTASLPDGRTDTDFGSVPTNGMGGEKLANCYLKAITKAKRRVTLSLLGLGMLDETEVATIPDAQVLTEEQAMQIEARPAVEQAPPVEEVYVPPTAVEKMIETVHDGTTWWTVKINHQPPEFHTDDERLAEVVSEARRNQQQITAVLTPKRRADGGEGFIAKDVAMYEGGPDA